MIFVILAILLVSTFGCDIYISLVLARNWPLLAKAAVFLPTVLFFVSALSVMRGNWGWAVTLLIGILLCVILPKLLICLLSVVGKTAGMAYHPLNGVFTVIGIVAAAIICIGGLYGITFGWKHLVVKDVNIQSPSLPAAFDGYKIVQISDLHLGTFGQDTTHIHHMVDMINGLNPDLIVFTGDLVNFTYHEVLPFKDELSRLRAKDGVLSILGNHDYALYAARQLHDPDALLDRLIAVQRDMGWRLLLDESTAVSHCSDTIWIAGVQNIGKKFSANRGNLNKALSQIPHGAYTILLSHDPTHWEVAVQGKQDIPLTLSGHTHSMQVRVFGWSPSALIFDHWSGLYRQGGQQLYVSPGTGGNLPFRFGAWPEITLLTLSAS